jgi:ADP-ribose pyrophosphatase
MRVLLRETVFKGRLLTVVRKIVENSDGSKWEREVVTYGRSASTIVPFYNGKFVFVKQFRPTIEDFILEFPAGRIEE